jgi:hypothetical protein
MEEPALTEAGHCYEKELLVQHFKKNGGIDPFTRKPIRQIFYSAFNVK